MRSRIPPIELDDAMESLAEMSEQTASSQSFAFHVPIFIYHGFYRSAEELRDVPARQHRYYLPIKKFEAHLDYLAENQFRVCSLSDYLKKADAATQKTVILSFDDGHISNYDWVWPMLRARSMNATFFAVADWVDRPGRIGRSQLREMVADGMSIESHGLTHSPLSRLPIATLEKELVHSREILEQMIGMEVKQLAVPGGWISPAVVENAEQAGYETVCCSVPGLASRGFVLNRLSVTSVTSLETFQALANQRRFELFKTRAVYFAIQSAKRLIGVASYEKVCGQLLRSKPSKA